MDRKQVNLRAVLGAVLVSLFLVVGFVYAATIPIDTFDDDVAHFRLSVLDTTGYRVDAGEGDHASILGGEQDARLTLFPDGDLNTEEITATLNGYDQPSPPAYIDTNTLRYRSDAGITGELVVTWDGNDDDGGASLNHTGLGSVNLVDSTNDGLLISVLQVDQNTSVEFQAYSDSSNWSETSLGVAADTSGGLERLDLFFPFDDASLWTDHGTGVDWQNLGALVLVVNGSPNLDLVIDHLEATTAREYGDLPSAYGTTVLDASHIPLGLRMGHNCDAESDDNASSDTEGDDSDRTYDDEDGVTPVGAWSGGINSGQVDIVVAGCGSGCYVNGWIDWDYNDSFSGTYYGADEHIINDSYVTSDITHTFSFNVPTSDFGGRYYYARFRICETSGTCNTVIAQDVFNGEIEDYRWYWGPTAVTLTDVTARTTPTTIILVVAGVLGLGALTVLFLARRRHRSL